MIKLPPMPPRIAALPRDVRGYPIPWFVWRDPSGKPDFRVVEQRGMSIAARKGTCWICGQRLGAFKVFIAGPMMVTNRVSGEPPSHKECAEFAVQACPFMMNPRMKMSTSKTLPDRAITLESHEKHNPGVTVLWSTKTYKIAGIKGGFVFRLGDPEWVSWWREGRAATRAEAQWGMNMGLPIMHAEAEQIGISSAEMNRMISIGMSYLPPK